MALIRRVLRETGLPPEQLELELTEGLLLSNADVTFPVLQELKEMGLKLAIDDFGTGYSSLSYLRQFPVSKLKIDASFVRELDANPDDAVIIVAIITMAKSLKLRVIAEGVENEAQARVSAGSRLRRDPGLLLQPADHGGRGRGKAGQCVRTHGQGAGHAGASCQAERQRTYLSKRNGA